MTITTEQAVALAEKHGFGIRRYGNDGSVLYFTEQQLAAMLNDHRQQVIEQLAQESGVMPYVYNIEEGDFCAPDDVRDALASMQARVEQLERMVRVARTTLGNYTMPGPLGGRIPIDSSVCAELDAAINKERVE